MAFEIMKTYFLSVLVFLAFSLQSPTAGIGISQVREAQIDEPIIVNHPHFMPVLLLVRFGMCVADCWRKSTVLHS